MFPIMLGSKAALPEGVRGHKSAAHPLILQSLFVAAVVTKAAGNKRAVLCFYETE